MSFYTDVIQKDQRFHSQLRISDVTLLEPTIRAAVDAIMSEARAQGIPLFVWESFRSDERQSLLYAQGATRLRTVGVHHFGLAADLVKSINAEPSWKGDFTFLGALARKHGLVWGGDWGAPKMHHTFVDDDHVQRCSIAMQPELFAGTWYPDASYSPYA